MQDRPVHDEHVRALLLIASDLSDKLVEHIQAHEVDRFWQQDSLHAARSINDQLAMVPELTTLRNQLVVVESILALAASVNDACGDRWSLCISLMMEQAHRRLIAASRKGQRRRAAA